MTTISTMNRSANPILPLTLEQHLVEARHRIQVSEDELREARRRRRLLSDALVAEFPGSATYLNGSVAHGDALTPLTDVDLASSSRKPRTPTALVRMAARTSRSAQPRRSGRHSSPSFPMRRSTGMRASAVS